MAAPESALRCFADEAHHPLPHERASGQDRPALQNGSQVLSQLAGCLVALSWIFRQALEDNRLQDAADPGGALWAGPAHR